MNIITRKQVLDHINKMIDNGHKDFIKNIYVKWLKKEISIPDADTSVKKELSYLNIQKVTVRPYGIIFKLNNHLIHYFCKRYNNNITMHIEILK